MEQQPLLQPPGLSGNESASLPSLVVSDTSNSPTAHGSGSSGSGSGSGSIRRHASLPPRQLTHPHHLSNQHQHQHHQQPQPQQPPNHYRQSSDSAAITIFQSDESETAPQPAAPTPPAAAPAPPAAQPSLASLDYDILELLGRGAYGKVYKVKRKRDNFICVMKQVPMEGLPPSEWKAAMNEAKVLSEISLQGRHPNIIAYYDSFLEEKQLNIVMEYADGGDLAALLRSNNGLISDETVLWNYLIQMLQGFEFLHSRRILHRDIKPHNIFIDSKGPDGVTFKIGDLGFGTILGNGMWANTGVGTPLYFSPELCEGKPYNDKADVWALGCLAYQMAAGALPFVATNQIALAKKIVNEHPAPLPESLSIEFRHLVWVMLEKDPAKRPAVADILAFPCMRIRLEARQLAAQTKQLSLIIQRLETDLMKERQTVHQLKYQQLTAADTSTPALQPRNRSSSSDLPSSLPAHDLRIHSLESELADLKRHNLSLDQRAQEHRELIESLTQQNDLLRKQLASLSDASNHLQVSSKTDPTPPAGQSGTNSVIHSSDGSSHGSGGSTDGSGRLSLRMAISTTLKETEISFADPECSSPSLQAQSQQPTTLSFPQHAPIVFNQSLNAFFPQSPDTSALHPLQASISAPSIQQYSQPAQQQQQQAAPLPSLPVAQPPPANSHSKHPHQALPPLLNFRSSYPSNSLHSGHLQTPDFPLAHSTSFPSTVTAASAPSLSHSAAPTTAAAFFQSPGAAAASQNVPFPRPASTDSFAKLTSTSMPVTPIAVHNAGGAAGPPLPAVPATGLAPGHLPATHPRRSHSHLSATPHPHHHHQHLQQQQSSLAPAGARPAGPFVNRTDGPVVQIPWQFANSASTSSEPDYEPAGNQLPVMTSFPPPPPSQPQPQQPTSNFSPTPAFASGTNVPIIAASAAAASGPAFAQPSIVSRLFPPAPPQTAAGHSTRQLHIPFPVPPSAPPSAYPSQGHFSQQTLPRSTSEYFATLELQKSAAAPNGQHPAFNPHNRMSSMSETLPPTYEYPAGPARTHERFFSE